MSLDTHLEIEKKFLIRQNGTNYGTSSLWTMFQSTDALKDTVLREGAKIRQGYLPVEVGFEIARIVDLDLQFVPTEARLRDMGGEYFLTLKSGEGLLRNESPDTKVSNTVFNSYWPYATKRIEKVRLEMAYEGHTAEIDVYSDRDLIVAEVEVPNIAAASTINALGKDITENADYKNKRLAKTDFLRKFVLTGGPSCGKTITINYLGQLQYPIIEESARQVIQSQQSMGGSIVPWEKFLEFQVEVLHHSLQSEKKLEGWGTAFLDRGIPDMIAYCVELGQELLTPIREAIEKRDYKGVFVLDPVPYKKDAQRKEDEPQAKRLHDKLFEQYVNLGFDPVSVSVDLELPIETSIKERAHFIVKKSYELG